MNSMEIDQEICRICLEQTGILNWNTEIDEFSGTTYSDCYYKYTQVNEQDSFYPLLCEKCSTDLKATHFLIQKALESHKILQEIVDRSRDTSFIIKVENEITIQDEDTAKFESLFFKQSKADDNDKQIPMNKSTRKTPKTKRQVAKRSKVKEIKLETNNDCSEVFIDIPQPSEVLNLEDNNEDTCNEMKSKSFRIVCQYCSKLIRACYIKTHEKTHQKQRERNTTCPICNLKLYHKGGLYSHMRTHEKNREKKYQCEFCEKAYFNRGTLNVHRRIHLGKMITCTLCPKQYCRQLDLDKHMTSHSATPLNANAKLTKPKYIVKCQECGKSIRSNKFKQHQAMHLNKPVVRCNICNKDFFSNLKCTKHIGQVHKKSQTNEFKTFYEENKDNRLSHLMIKQTEIIEKIGE